MKPISRILLENKLYEDVGRTIIDQIHTIDRFAIGAWGSLGRGRIQAFRNEEEALSVLSLMGNYPVNIGTTKAAATLKTTRGGVIFKINTPNVSNGYLIVSLSGKDLYDISVGQIRKGVWKDKFDKDDIFAEDLVSVIDGMVG